MKNIFSDLQCSKVYDLKGSTHNRKATKKAGASVVLKDLDWIEDRMKFKLEKGLQSFISQVIESDTNFLKSLNIMDYSLLIGIHPIQGNPEAYIESLKRPEDDNDAYSNGVKKAIHNRFRGGVISHDKSCIYVFSIIDIYTNYSGTKKMESFLKTLAFGYGVSSVNPAIYAARFRLFVTTQFI